MKDGIRPFKLQWMKEHPEKEKWRGKEMGKAIHAAVEVGVLRLSMDDGWASKFNELGRICGLNRDGDRGVCVSGLSTIFSLAL